MVAPNGSCPTAATSTQPLVSAVAHTTTSDPPVAVAVGVQAKVHPSKGSPSKKRNEDSDDETTAHITPNKSLYV